MQPNENGTIQYHFDVFADYHQVYLDDCRLHEELTRADGRDERLRSEEIAAWVDTVLSPEAHVRHLGVAHGTLCILTARNYTVPLEVQIQAVPLMRPNSDELAGWDHIVEAGLDLPSGCLAIHGPTDYYPDAPRIEVAPGTYRTRVYYGGISTVSEDQLDGEDRYRVTLWPAPGPVIPPAVLYSHVVGIW